MPLFDHWTRLCPSGHEHRVTPVGADPWGWEHCCQIPARTLAEAQSLLECELADLEHRPGGVKRQPLGAVWTLLLFALLPLIAAALWFFR
jgi:hypothetical protein